MKKKIASGRYRFHVRQRDKNKPLIVSIGIKPFKFQHWEHADNGGLTGLCIDKPG